ncbi:MAG: NrfD/PsrC family molybdoenzyme membrane anchor subunit [Adlercreutzia sp.]|nr:NrfD/PsrC family molybdoenzyme membrane anchor subunit [Adlercreutzia sp.]
MVSIYIALYLFCAGAGGGAFLLGSVVDLVLRFRPQAARGWFARVSAVTDAGLVLGPVLVVVSAAFLVLDLGVPEKALYLFFVSNQSLLSMGAWAILLFAVTAFGALALGVVAADGSDEGDVDPSARRVILRAIELGCSLLATGFALFVVVYSGVFLALYPSLPFLHTPWIPVLFVASAMATGLAALMVVAFFRQPVPGMMEGARSLLGLDAALIVLEAAALLVFLVAALASGFPARSGALMVLTGSLAPAFWIGVVVLGLVAPFSVDMVCRATPSFPAVALGAAGTLVGGLVLRVVLLMATQRFNLAFMSVLPFWS